MPTLTQVQYDAAYEVLRQKHEPEYQSAKATVLLARIKEELRQVHGWKDGSGVATTRLPHAMQITADRVIKEWLLEDEQQHQPYFQLLAVKVVQEDVHEIEVVPNYELQHLMFGTAPIQLFKPSREVLEKMAVEYIREHIATI